MEFIVALFLVIVAAVGVVWKLLKPENTAAAGGSVEPPAAYERHVSLWEPYAKRYGRRFGIPWEIIQAIIWQESGGDPKAVGSAGEIGLMQLKQIAVDDVERFTEVDTTGWDEDPISNIRVGSSQLAIHLRPGRADGNMFEALRMYNQGVSGAYTRPEKSRRYANEVLTKARFLGYE